MFKKGNLALCIDTGVNLSITRGRIYAVLSNEANGIKIKNDKNTPTFYFTYRFVPISKNSILVELL